MIVAAVVKSSGFSSNIRRNVTSRRAQPVGNFYKTRIEFLNPYKSQNKTSNELCSLSHRRTCFSLDWCKEPEVG